VNNLNLSDDKLNALLAMAGKKLGKSPEELKAALQSGSMDGVLGGMSEENRSKIAGVLKNPGALDALLKNEQVRKMMSQYSR
jgi:type IV secretory pathway TrbL component